MTDAVPTFVGIGVPRGGTTWLHRLVGSHPSAFTPPARKEVHYFDREYDRGRQWYLDFFKDASADQVARGEFTPHYLFHKDAPARVRDFGIDTALLILRNPTDRLWSNFLFRVRQGHFTGSLNEFLDAHPEVVDWSRYSNHVERWQQDFGDGLHVLIHETASAHPDALCEQLGQALGIDSALFPSEVVHTKVNDSRTPRFPRAYQAAVRVNKGLFDRDLDRVAHSLKRIPGATRVLRLGRSDTPRLAAHERDQLDALFADDVAKLEQLLSTDLTPSGWVR